MLRRSERGFANSGTTAFLVLFVLGLAVFLLEPERVVGGPDDPPAHLPLAPVEALLDGCFTTSTACAVCHSSSPGATAMRDSSGASIAPFDLWQSSMMANSARDPLWRAMVSAEIVQTPSRKADIEAKCLQCHAPMAAVESQHAGDRPKFIDLYDDDARYRHLAIDGVSCTVCHQISPDNLGDPSSFSGRFEINGSKEIYGPHDNLFSGPMQVFTDFTPMRGDHIMTSELCATCHTLETESFEADGTPNGHTFLEQSPYLEWASSIFARGESPTTCQTCHMPRFDVNGKLIETAIARNPGGRDFPPVGSRSPYGQHVFVGGNTLVPAMLRDHRDVLQPQAPDAAFDRTIAMAKQQLQTRTARVSIEDERRTANSLEFSIRSNNMTGHKFPTAHPTRRAWLHVRVTQGGRTLFESGGYDSRGRILDEDGEIHAAERVGGPVHEPRTVLDSSGDVVTYEGVMADSAGKPTWSLIRAAKWYSDTRLLPIGFETDDPRLAPTGTEGDADFAAGSDRVRVEVPLTGSGPVEIEVELVYQTLGSRFAAELLKFDTPEVREFGGYYRQADVTPVIIANERKTIPAATTSPKGESERL